MDLVDGPGLPLLDQGLEAQLEVGQRVRVEQLAQLLLAEQLAEEVPVQGQGLGAALGHRRVAVVHVGGHVVEQQRARERRGARRLDRVDGDLAPPDAAEHVAQGRQVEHVGQALAVRLDEDREAPVARRDRQQVRGPLALLPQRRARARAGAAAGAARGRRSRGIGWRTGSTRRPGRRPGPRPRRGRGTAAPRRRRASRRPRAGGSRCRRPTRWSGPRGPSRSASRASIAMVHGAWTRPPNGRQDDQAPVAQLVAEALDHDPPVGRQDARGLALVLEVGEQVLGRQRVEVVVAPQALGRPRPPLRPLRQVRLDLAGERADRPAQLDRPARRRRRARTAACRGSRRRRHDHAVGRDVRDAPGACAEHDHVAVHARPELVDHLLVELADPSAGRPRLALEEHRIQAAVRDRAAAGDRDRARVRPRRHHVGEPVPGDPGLELRELVRRVGAREHPQDALQRLPRQRLEWRGAADRRPAARRPRTARRASSRRSAGRARRAGSAARSSARSPRPACRGPRPRSRAGRRGTWGR